jgi:hypothetical protein
MAAEQATFAKPLIGKTGTGAALTDLENTFEHSKLTKVGFATDLQGKDPATYDEWKKERLADMDRIVAMLTLKPKKVQRFVDGMATARRKNKAIPPLQPGSWSG